MDVVQALQGGYGSAQTIPYLDFDLIAEKTDFLGVNYYTRSVTRFDANAWPQRARGIASFAGLASFRSILSRARNAFIEFGGQRLPQP